MHGMVRRWGNSAAVRIPASVLHAAALRIDEAVTIRAEEGRIIIEKPAPSRRYKLDDLLAGITDENAHEPIGTGRPVGREVL
jgi:antitoxin MazE